MFPLGFTGLLIAVQTEYFNILNYKELHFNDIGDRVAQLLHVELALPFSQWRNGDIRQEILIVNTHLLFPHDATLSLVRLKQVSKKSNVVYIQALANLVCVWFHSGKYQNLFYLMLNVILVKIQMFSYYCLQNLV